MGLSSINKIIFIMTIDTEEEGLWGGDYKRHPDCSVENIKYLPAFQEFCNRLGIRPTYLIDYPVATQKNSVRILRSLLEQNGCEIGAHLHPWCNPPYQEEINNRNSYPNNLPTELHHKKLDVLTKAIEDNFNIRPVSYRAGRYGFDETTIPVLEDLNYLIDTSIVPYRNNGIPDEPSFGMVPLNPYYLDYQDVCHPGESKILEVPITVDYTRHIPQFLRRLYPDLPNVGIRRLLKILFDIDQVWLRPSYADLDNMKKLVDTVITSNVRILNMMFHSSELMPGGSPYNKTAKDVDRFMLEIKNLVQYLSSHYEMKFMTLKEVAEQNSD